MAYNGPIAIIPLGLGGLNTDDSQIAAPLTSLITAKNCWMVNGLIEKEPGSRRYNATGFDSGVRAVYDWWPDEVTQRLIVVTASGKVWKMKDQFAATEITASGSAPALLTPGFQTHILACGSESAGRTRKLFIYTGKDPVQVISGDDDIRTNLALPPVDWSGTNQPSFGFVHRSRIISLGNSNNRHQIYISDDDNHENYLTDAAQYAVYPGVSERLFTGFVYKNRAFLGKYPSKLYYIDDGNPNILSWGIGVAHESFGVASPHAAVEVLDDLLVANATGSITSLNATQSFGDVEAGDVLANLKNESYMRKTTSPNGTLDRHAIYYSNKKLAMFTYRSAGGVTNDRILYIDATTPSSPKVHWSEKDQPNVLALRKDEFSIERPIYGSEDGYVYLMDQPDRDVGGSAYRMEFQTPHFDFAGGDPVKAEGNKIYQFLEVVFEPTGRWNAYIEVFIDGKYIETIPFKVSRGPVLRDFKLSRDRLTQRIPVSVTKPLHGMGRRISFKVYNEGYRENIRVTKLQVYYKYSGQQQSGEKR